MRIYIDIDGTLTTDGENAWGPVRPRSLELVRELREAGHDVYLWSARGIMYALKFTQKHGMIDVAIVLGKPDIYIDDHKEIRAAGRMRYIDPDTFEQAASVAELLAGDDK